MLPGFVDRLKNEVMGLAPKSVQVSIISPPEREFCLDRRISARFFDSFSKQMDLEVRV